MPLCPQTIELEGFCLRAWRADDAPARARHGSSPKISRYMHQSFGCPHTLETAAEFIAQALETERDIFYCISRQGEAIGSVSLIRGEDNRLYSAEVGYWLGEDYWGRGIMLRALKAAMQAGISQHGLHRYFATVEPGNLASAKVLQSAGFSLEGRLKHAAVRQGRYYDHLIYGYIVQ